MGSKISLTVDETTLKQLEQAAEKEGQVRTEWIADSIRRRLGDPISTARFAEAVAEAMASSRGKLSRADAMAVASRVIVAMNR